MAVPFLPARSIVLFRYLSWLNILQINSDAISEKVAWTSSQGTLIQLNDFTLSVSRYTFNTLNKILFGVWVMGIVVVVFMTLKSQLSLNKIRKSSLPLQNQKVTEIYKSCLNEMNIRMNIPVYCTMLVKSPMIAGFFKPCIFLPAYLVSDCPDKDMRYILLHELQHYKYKDGFVNYMINFIYMLYWFNPFVKYALKEMQNDREIACDISVLKMLNKDEYIEYGNALINFAEKVYVTSVSLAAGIGSGAKQMKQRIINIAEYEKPSVIKHLKSALCCVMISCFTLCFVPIISLYASENNRYNWNTASKNIDYMDFSSYFDGYDGSFVLYDSIQDLWIVYNKEKAVTQASPNSTYKIYDALWGLEENIITPKNSQMNWNGTEYPFNEWNADQNLKSAMEYSVNWYFQKIDENLGKYNINKYIRKTGYGNENITGSISSYWLESSLKISPVEQVELLNKLYYNSFDFSQENINAVKKSICISTSANGTFSGKTGTGQIDGKNENGWFIGYVENTENTYFFAANINADNNASGTKAAEITYSILSDLNIW